MPDNVLLSVKEMYQADAAAEAAGVASLDLMEAAGRSVADAIQQRWQQRPVAVLAGPGNNGGDGFVVARLLGEAGWPVRLGLLGKKEKLKGDAAINAGRWLGDTEDLSPSILDDDPLVIDSLFGAGLARPLEGEVRQIIEAVNARSLDCLGVDIPSGVLGDSGDILGDAPNAAITVTFFRPKPGHFLMPGRERCGEIVVADIGIPESVLALINPQTFLNGPGLWLDHFPWPDMQGHKYSRGHAVVLGGAEMTGAARLAAMGARRTGAGLVSIASPPEAFALYAAEEPGTLVNAVGDDNAFAALLADERKNAILAGPGAGMGAGVNETTRERILTALASGKAVVIDADGLSVFADNPDTLFKAISGPCLLTPHEGEFKRLFSHDGDKVCRVRAAAEQSGAVVLLKGPDTVIAAADGRASINSTGTPDLATAGSGDVLAGMALGLMTQGMAPFETGCAAAWMHGRLAEKIGSGLISEDLPGFIPEILKELKAVTKP
ncbi:MAG: NAD(P)H-hydrate dehydratase [Rhodospirillales bacterium]